MAASHATIASANSLLLRATLFPLLPPLLLLLLLPLPLPLLLLPLLLPSLPILVADDGWSTCCGFPP